MLLNELLQPTKVEPNKDLSDDIIFFINHDDDIHKEYFLPAVDELKRLKIIDKDEVKEVSPYFKNMVDVGCKKYYKEFKIEGKEEEVFNDDFKKYVCDKFAEKQVQHIKSGHYDPKES